MGACSPSSESDKSNVNTTATKGFSISLPVHVVLTESNSIKPSALGQLMKLTNFGLKKVFLVTNGQPWKGATAYLSPMFGSKIKFVQLASNEDGAALEMPTQAYEITHSQQSHWQKFLFNWLSKNNVVITFSSEDTLSAFTSNIDLLHALQVLLSSAEFQSVDVNKGETYFLDESNLLEGRLLQQTDKQTTLLVLNQTDEIRSLPLPFGFMAVAKVTRWQTGESEFATFVTSTPLTIAPYSIALIIRK